MDCQKYSQQLAQIKSALADFNDFMNEPDNLPAQFEVGKKKKSECLKLLFELADSIDPDKMFHRKYLSSLHGGGFVTNIVDGLAGVVINGKFAIINDHGKKLTPPQFDRINDIHLNMAVASSGKKEYVINNKGINITPNGCVMAAIMENDLIFASYNWEECYGLNQKGEILIDQSKALHYPKGPGMITVEKKSNEFYFCNHLGQKLDWGKFELAEVFSDGLALVKKDGKCFGIDQNGKKVFDLDDDFIQYYPFYEGFAMGLRNNRRWYFFDKHGKEILGLNMKGYLLPADFEDGLARVQNEDGWFFIDKTGAAISDDVYTELQPFVKGIAAVEQGENSFYIKRNGERLNNENYLSVENFSEGYGLVRLQNGLFNFINTDGEKIPFLDFHQARSFINGHAAVESTRGGWYFINANGFKISESFEEVRDFARDRAFVKKEGKWYVMDQNYIILNEVGFDEVASELFSSGGELYSGAVKVKVGNREFMIDKNGRKVFN